MGRICWKIAALIGLIVFSQTASAGLNEPVSMSGDYSAHRNVSLQEIGARSIAAVVRDSGSRLNHGGVQSGLDQPSLGPLAQAQAPAASTTVAAPDPKGPPEQSPPAGSSPPPTSTAVVEKAGPTARGCGLKYLAAELAGKLKGRKWKEFRQEECGATATQAVFPSVISPKYSGESPDKARTLTCADQFKANKAANANDGMKWIEKGGGYYSECVSRLKG